MTEPLHWSVLILCAGRSTELIRPELRKHLEAVGFEAHVYDSPGYPADPSLDNVSACVAAIDQHDFVLAVIDEEEGSEVDPADLDPKTREDLQDNDLIPPVGSDLPPPTIVQLEVGVAIASGKPTLVLLTESARGSAREVTEMLTAGDLSPTPRVNATHAAEDLIAEEDWKALAAEYDVPSGRLASFRHLVFINELLGSEWVRFFDSGDLNDLRLKVTDALATLPLALSRAAFAQSESRLEKSRTPLGGLSLADLLQQSLILAPPFRIDSGGPGTGDLYSPGIGGGLLESWLLARKSVLLLGNPGLGKSTITMLVYPDLEGAATSVPPIGVLWGRWRDMLEAPNDWEEALRYWIGVAYQRTPWPESLPLPRLRWILLLDGLDESPLPTDDVAEILIALSTNATLLVTCRRDDYHRYVEAGGSVFAVQVELAPWEEDHLNAYSDALEVADQKKAADAVRGMLALRRRPEMIGYPLWLSMLTYLVEHENDLDFEKLNDYELLRRTMGAVASAELVRKGGSRSDASRLEEFWAETAWLLNEFRRSGRGRLTNRELSAALEVGIDEPIFSATCSLLDTDGRLVRGFRHEVLHDYWLGEYVAARLPTADAEEVVRLLGRQRRALANDAVRGRLELDGRAGEAAGNLQRRFFEIPAGPGVEFVKNQILYFLGRLGDIATARTFLAVVWRSQEPDFVRYSAGFTGAMIGAEGVEKEYFAELTENENSDALNRGYHLFYHGDVDEVAEGDMPYLDEGSVPADRSIEVLIERLKETDDTNLRLRRIELFTLRRFIETRKLTWAQLPPELPAILDKIDTEVDDSARKEAVATETAALRAAVGLDAPTTTALSP